MEGGRMKYYFVTYSQVALSGNRITANDVFDSCPLQWLVEDDPEHQTIIHFYKEISQDEFEMLTGNI